MAKRFVVSIHQVDEDGNVLNSKNISIKDIIRPESIEDLGYSRQEGLDIIKQVEEGYLDFQRVFLK